MTTTKTPSKAAPKKAAPVSASKTVRRPLQVKTTHPRESLIPDKMFAENYINRNVHLGSSDPVIDFDVFDQAQATRHNILLFGPTGSSKTSALYGWASARKMPLANIACNGSSDPFTMFGGLRPQASGGFRTMPTDVYYVMRYGGLIVLDEFNSMPPKIASVFHGALDLRRIVTIDQYQGCTDEDEMGNLIVPTFKLHKDCVFSACYNPGYSGMYTLNEATFNRFAIKLPWPYDPEIERQIVISDVLVNFAEAVRRQGEAGTITTPVPTNLLTEFETFAQSLGVRFAAENMLATFANEEREGVRKALEPDLPNIAREIAEFTGDKSVLTRFLKAPAEDNEFEIDLDNTDELETV